MKSLDIRTDFKKHYSFESESQIMALRKKKEAGSEEAMKKKYSSPKLNPSGSEKEAKA